MDIDLIFAIYQSLTGIATVMATTFLAVKLVMQKKQLEIAHIDSNRNLAFVSRTRTQELTLAEITSEPLPHAYENATYGFDELDDTDTRKLFGM